MITSPTAPPTPFGFCLLPLFAWRSSEAHIGASEVVEVEPELEEGTVGAGPFWSLGEVENLKPVSHALAMRATSSSANAGVARDLNTFPSCLVAQTRLAAPGSCEGIC